MTHDEAVLEALLLCVLPPGEALGVPVMLVGLRRYTSDENRRQAFALFYVVMNVGVLLSAPAVDVFRLALADGVDVRSTSAARTTSTCRRTGCRCSAASVRRS